MALTFEEYAKARDAIEARMNAASEALNQFPRNSMGLVSDEIRTSTEYRFHKAQYNRAFQELRQLNAVDAKRFTKEIKAEIAAKRQAKLAATQP